MAFGGIRFQPQTINATAGKFIFGWEFRIATSRKAGLTMTVSRFSEWDYGIEAYIIKLAVIVGIEKVLFNHKVH